ncbi:MAG TPA: tetratricopeptide repeat protein [Magnetospirillaceae bacterium]|jgi:hypothetical protein
MANASDEDRTGDLLIQEVDDDLRHEQYVRLWKRYGSWVISAAIAVVIVVAGYQAWQSWQARKRSEAAESYGAALALQEAGKTKDAEAAFAKIETSDSKGFAVLAGMRRADALAQGGDVKGAMAAYDQLSAASVPQLFRDLATLKEGLIALNATPDKGGDTAAVEAKIGALATSGNPWYYEANELTALFAHKKGDDKHAIELFKQLADDAQAPQGIRARAAEMIVAIGPPVGGSAAAAAASPAAPAAAAPAAPAAASKTQDKK